MATDVPTVGGARGIFEYLVPGVFLLANLVAAVACLPIAVGLLPFLLAPNNSLGLTVLVVCAGYLIGVLLRLVRADTPDRWSSWYTKRFHPSAKNIEPPPMFAVDNFPYIAWLGQSCADHLPPSAMNYWEIVWRPRERTWRNKPFLNLCKMAIVHSNPSVAAEIYAAEALTRYVACMFYALRLGILIAIVSTVLALLRGIGNASAIWAFLTISYSLALWVIVKQFRFIRFKEVDTVFCACYLANVRFEREAAMDARAATA